MIQQHIDGIRPISIESALTYAEGFCVPIKKISPRVAQFIEKANQINQKFSPGPYVVSSIEKEKVFIWPFESVTKDQYDAMDESDKSELEKILKIKVDKNKGISKTGTS